MTVEIERAALLFIFFISIFGLCIDVSAAPFAFVLHSPLKCVGNTLRTMAVPPPDSMSIHFRQFCWFRALIRSPGASQGASGSPEWGVDKEATARLCTVCRPGRPPDARGHVPSMVRRVRASEPRYVTFLRAPGNSKPEQRPTNAGAAASLHQRWLSSDLPPL